MMDPELYKAAIDGTLSEKTLRAAADSNQLVTGGKKSNILHVAAKSGNLQINTEEEGHVEMVRFLIVKARKMDAQQKRKLVTMKNFEGDTALHEAVRHNRFEIVKLLIHEDSNLASVLNGYGESPLFMAVARCFYEIGLFILNATAPNNCSFDGRNGMNVLHAACGAAGLHMYALHISAMKGHVDVVRTLINKCPDICELKDDRDRTALHVAVESREEEMVKFLLESIAFQDLIVEKDNEGNTALHISSVEEITKFYKFWQMTQILTERLQTRVA
ncbi:ankyrin repeat-containing protein NPR4-like [Ziziphus jujuba]|uniref:Ankyrin repeat-containing protein NPR4-like n=1 Tax=Ziziphus jujuba TaxID=326968 RepID=A0ABM4AFP4_ZIZJJ|nr:ankyrin repeat-containing protein NPR4-like [Ziziphus jujuba]